MKNIKKREVIGNYGLYSIVYETDNNGKSNLYLELGYGWAAVFMRLNINAFWHDLAAWKRGSYD